MSEQKIAHENRIESNNAEKTKVPIVFSIPNPLLNKNATAEAVPILNKCPEQKVLKANNYL